MNDEELEIKENQTLSDALNWITNARDPIEHNLAVERYLKLAAAVAISRGTNLQGLDAIVSVINHKRKEK